MGRAHIGRSTQDKNGPLCALALRPPPSCHTNKSDPKMSCGSHNAALLFNARINLDFIGGGPDTAIGVLLLRG